MWTIVGALLIGLLLGLLGSGGSILTVPVLVYLLGHEAKPAIAESLAIVGGISVAGAIPYAAAKQIDWRNAWFFGIPGMIGTYLGAWLAHYVAAVVQLILFAGVMLLAAWMMYRQSPPPVEAAEAHSSDHRHPLWKIVVEGLVVGIITGLVGVGGGFLIIPALVLLGGLPMRLAVGTSLVVIAIKSLAGFLKYLDVLADSGDQLDWITVAWFMGIGIAGTIAGKSLGSMMNQKALQRTFAIFLVVMGLFVFSQEIPKLFGAHTSPAATGRPASVEPTTKDASDPAMAPVANQADQQEQAGEREAAKFDLPRTPKDALQELKAGNVRFLEGKLINPHREFNYRESLLEAQHPLAVVLGCSDSRAPPTVIFDQGLGDLFIIRNAGNIVDTEVLASAEYAVHNLKTNLIVVLGHTHCGAVTAAVDRVGENRDNPDDLLELLRRLNDSIQPLEDTQPRSTRIDVGTVNNVRFGIKTLAETPYLSRRLAAGDLLIVGAVYDIHSGAVHFLDENP